MARSARESCLLHIHLITYTVGTRSQQVLPGPPGLRDFWEGLGDASLREVDCPSLSLIGVHRVLARSPSPTVPETMRTGNLLCGEPNYILDLTHNRAGFDPEWCSSTDGLGDVHALLGTDE